MGGIYYTPCCRINIFKSLRHKIINLLSGCHKFTSLNEKYKKLTHVVKIRHTVARDTPKRYAISLTIRSHLRRHKTKKIHLAASKSLGHHGFQRVPE